MLLVSSCSCLCPIHWSHMFNREWRCSWSSTDRRCTNYIWVINKFIAYWGAAYIWYLTVIQVLMSTNNDIRHLDFRYIWIELSKLEILNRESIYRYLLFELTISKYSIKLLISGFSYFKYANQNYGKFELLISDIHLAISILMKSAIRLSDIRKRKSKTK